LDFRKNQPLLKTACSQAFSKNCLIASLFKKGLSENSSNVCIWNNYTQTLSAWSQAFSKKAWAKITAKSKTSWRRDQPAQRLRPNGCGSTVV